jgi:hypothetical protein
MQGNEGENKLEQDDNKLNPSFRDGASAPDPESRDSGFDASHRPGMTDSSLRGACHQARIRAIRWLAMMG